MCDERFSTIHTVKNSYEYILPVDNSQRDLVSWGGLDQLNEFYGFCSWYIWSWTTGESLWVNVLFLYLKKLRKVAEQSYRFSNLDIVHNDVDYSLRYPFPPDWDNVFKRVWTSHPFLSKVWTPNCFKRNIQTKPKEEVIWDTLCFWFARGLG